MKLLLIFILYNCPISDYQEKLNNTPLHTLESGSEFIALTYSLFNTQCQSSEQQDSIFVIFDEFYERNQSPDPPSPPVLPCERIRLSGTLPQKIEDTKGDKAFPFSVRFGLPQPHDFRRPPYDFSPKRVIFPAKPRNSTNRFGTF